MTPATEHDGFPRPEIRARPDAAGTPVELADGNEWLLADGGIGNALDEIRDRLFDQSVLRGEVGLDDVRYVAWVLLAENYRLEILEGRALILGADGEKLADAVYEALFGRPDAPRSYTAWALSSLLANGIDPASVPGPVRGFVLDQLVETGRAVPCAQFCESVERKNSRAALRAHARKQKAK